jgi:hypothetical protein
MPDITVYINCDTRLAINLESFDLGENDELIFAIKNYSYINSPYVFLFRARKSDIDENGEVIFKIAPAASKHLKPGAFYNFAVLRDAFDKRKETEYKKLTDNGNILLEYGAQDLTIPSDNNFINNSFGCEVTDMRLELIDEISSIVPTHTEEITGVRLELIDEISSVVRTEEIVGMRLELVDDIPTPKPEPYKEEIVRMRLEPIAD